MPYPPIAPGSGTVIIPPPIAPYTQLDTGDVDDTPVDGATTAPISSNWAYDHEEAVSGVQSDNRILIFVGL